jgi:hypothetical protein
MSDSDSDEYFATRKIELHVSVASVSFYVIEEVDSIRLEEWRAFASGEADCIDYCCVGGLSGFDIKVKGDSATVSYSEFSDNDFHFNIDASIPASLFRAEIRRQLPD